MTNPSSDTSCRPSLPAFAALLVVFVCAAGAEAPRQTQSSDAVVVGINHPSGRFTALFNGKDFTGWHGMPQLDRRKLAAMTTEERSKKLAEWAEEFKKHWRVEKGELVNDGKVPYATTDKEFGNIQLLND